MNGGWRYRLLSVVGVAALTVGAVGVANLEPVQQVFSLLPVVGPLPFDSAVGVEFAWEAAIATVVVLGAVFSLYKPRPRRILDTWFYALKRVVVALLAMAAIGYADATYALPRATLIVTGLLLVVTLPVWFVVIRRRPRTDGERTIIIGDDPTKIADVLTAIDGPVLGYVSPPSSYDDSWPVSLTSQLTDGGEPIGTDDLPNLGGLSRLDDVLVEYDVGTAVLAFARPDRAEFFGALDTCYEHGVAAKVHRTHADVVLTRGPMDGALVDIDLEPWDWLDHVTKRLFDVVFAGTALLVLSPLIAAIAVAIKLDSAGPVLYRQTRTAAFGDTFTIAKFRSMYPESEDAAPVDDDENDRITRVGRVLRRTHLDEIPQLWPILRGEMSVVGPRAAWTTEEELLEAETDQWRRRWFVKPGLTGLAQVNDASSTNPEAKLRYDTEYIRCQSLWFDLKIVIRQLWMVATDIASAVAQRVNN
ncbi:sugar transferase [Halosegnis rubeus]|uniref:Sugar transferase n=1 Tax=Halosegnis rubeus TaxID=2212850 RepID=A0A5N5UGW5_9EURY|nr:sugar transferase [Halosegnis rubeus]KAB7517965.1 sugar transferase [Halosegnis rubeus]